MNTNPVTLTYDQAIEEAVDLLDRARIERSSAETYGYDTTAGDSGIPCFRLAEQYITEAQVWATVAQAITTRGREALEAGV